MIKDKKKKQQYSRAKITLKICIFTLKRAYVIEVKKSFILIER